MGIWGKYVSEQGLDNLKYYKYSGEDKSICVKLFMGSFWNGVLYLVPSWVAPNLITFTGFCIILVNFFTLLYFSPNLDVACPPWAYLTYGVGVFLYQLMDNLDGRQARKTKSSSALGELFDHGCDSLFVTIGLLPLYNAWLLSPWKSYIFLLLGVIPFYFAHWEEYYSGTLILHALGNPTEVQLLICLAHYCTWYHGMEWYQMSIETWENRYMKWIIPLVSPESLPDMTIHVFCMILVGLGLVAGVISNMSVVVRIVNENKELSMARAFANLFPLVMVLTSFTAWFWVSPADVLAHHTVACLLCVGLLTAYIVDRMIVDRVTKTQFTIIKPCYFAAVVGFLNALFLRNPETDVWYLYILLVGLVLSHIHFAVSVVHQLCDKLNIYCFVITSRPRKVQNE